MPRWQAWLFAFVAYFAFVALWVLISWLIGRRGD